MVSIDSKWFLYYLFQGIGRDVARSPTWAPYGRSLCKPYIVDINTMGTVRGTPNCPLTYGFDSINQDCLTAQLLQVKQNLFLKFHSSNMAQRRTKKNQFWTLTDLYMRKYELYLLYLIYESSSFRYLSLLSTPLYWGINPTNKLHSSTVLCTPIHPVEISF